MDRFKPLPGLAREHLLELADRVTNVLPIKARSLRIHTHQLDPKIEPKGLLGEVSALTRKNHSYLYYFEVLGNPDLAEIESTFLNAKATERNRREYSRFIRQSKFLYVGSCFKIYQRFKEHLGYGSRSTYSLQLAHWAYNLNLELDFIYAEYPQDIGRDILQVIEDTLWDKLQPMLGRRGQR